MLPQHSCLLKEFHFYSVPLLVQKLDLYNIAVLGLYYKYELS